MTRSEFLRFVAGLGTLTLAAAACKKSDDGQDPVDAQVADGPATPVDSPPGTVDAPATACPAPRATIGANHGHSLVVPAADIEAGVEKSYNIRGASAHPHTVIVTAAMFADLKQNKPVSVDSSEDADHIHAVSISCA